MPTTDVEGVQLFYTDSGEQAGHTGPPLVLLHGWTCDSHDWVFQFEAFEARHRVIALDLRGHGRSAVPESPDWSALRHAADVAAVLRRLGVERVVAVGHSLGGVVAAALAVEHADLVVATVGVEPAYGQDEATAAYLRDVTAEFGTYEGNALAARLQEATEPSTPAWLRAWHRRRTLGAPPAVLKEAFAGMYCAADQFCGQPHTDRYLARRASPALTFHRLPAMAAWEQQAMRHPYSRVVSWEGAGHWLHQERPAEFNDLALGWLASLPDAGTRT